METNSRLLYFPKFFLPIFAIGLSVQAKKKGRGEEFQQLLGGRNLFFFFFPSTKTNLAALFPPHSIQSLISGEKERRKVKIVRGKSIGGGEN